MRYTMSACLLKHLSPLRALAWAGIVSAACGAAAAQPSTVPCTGGKIQPVAVQTAGAGDPVQPALVVSGACTVEPGRYYFGQVNIVAGGSLSFVETTNGPLGNSRNTANDIDFWASSIIIENKGALVAGDVVPFGRHGGRLTIALYGRDQSGGDPVAKPGQGALCVSEQGKPIVGLDGLDDTTGPCGIPNRTWSATDDSTIKLPGGVDDYFYHYGPLYGDGAAGAGGVGYFGYKVLGLSYGGTLSLRGEKGTTGADAADASPMETGTSWARLADGHNLGPTSKEMVVAGPVQNDWEAGDQVVITTTDYLPDHSERVTIGQPTGATVPLRTTLEWQHNGTRFTILDKLGTGAQSVPGAQPSVVQNRLGLSAALTTGGVETRAAAALLTRSIRIISGGDIAGASFPLASTKYSFGGHTVFRQGFEKLQIQGVEFAQLGQGGRLAHYPVHFHMARQTPANTYVKDSVVNESMTRWFVIHSTLDVTLARNVGYKSIGHGFYLEDGTETGNKFYSNIGILARAAVHGRNNDRDIPGILAQNDVQGDAMPYISDINHPTVFWIMNGWNDFVGNFAVGAGTCGACYWLLPGINSNMTHSHNGMPGKPMKWSGYSALQAPTLVNGNNDVVYSGMAGTTPLRLFYGNSCGSAMNAFMTVGATAACNGVVAAPPKGVPLPGQRIVGVRSIAPTPAANFWEQTYYPRVDPGTRFATICDPNAAEGEDLNCARMASVGRHCAFGDPKDCAVTVVDRFTTAFNWADYNFSAVWLRSGWYLMQDSVISDVQNAGLTFVSGGDYTRSSLPIGYWGVVRKSVFIGTTQPNNPYADAAGPFNAASKVKCVNIDNACINIDHSVAMQLINFATSQRLFNIYDGPTYQDSNAYLDIRQSPCVDASCMYWHTPGVRLNPVTKKGYLPNAAIGWKQPNGFYYPPAFHSDNLYFNAVDIRHYLVEPILLPRTYLTDRPTAQTRFTGESIPADMFTGYTDIDRQTELNDDDGSLTGFRDTISVNQDDFFDAPIETAQCLSNLGVTPGVACSGAPPTRASAKTSPYDYVTTVVYPGCALAGNGLGDAACGSSVVETCTDSVVPDPLPNDPKHTKIDGRRCTAKIKRGGIWSRDCAGPFCFGVPIYRQFLTGSNVAGKETREWAQWAKLGCNTTPTSSNPFDPAAPKASDCLFPFARMAGTSTWQRSAMTVNGGTFYIDTTVSLDSQRTSQFAGLASDPNSVYVDCAIKKEHPCSPLSVNAFQKNQKYYVFFVYAKGDTKQVYQMYVGTGFDPATVKLARMNVNTAPFALVGTPTALPSGADGWTAEMVAGPDGQVDILQVTVNMKSFAGSLDPHTVANGTCMPSSFCTASGGSCGCALSDSDPRVLMNPGLKASCQQVCSSWAVQDLDCPHDGCLGFEVTLPDSFIAANQYKRPKPGTFPIVDSWTRTLQRTTTAPDGQQGGTCYYPQIPGTTQCPIGVQPLASPRVR